MHIVFAAGGTAGHIEPALNTADALRRLDSTVSISFIGSERGLESELVPARGYPLITTAAVPFPRRVSADLLRMWPALNSSVRTARDHLRSTQARVVVGFGGYAAVPGYLAAWRQGVPLVIHEANATAGLANKLGARLSSHTASVVPGVLPNSRRMGMPMRRAITSLDRQSARKGARERWGIPAEARVLLVFGGSQGAARLNSALEQALPDLVSAGIFVVHSYGTRNQEPAAQPGYFPVPYIADMAEAYAVADLALTRAGAMTCAELAAVGLPAAYVPLPIGNGEQRFNALPVVNAGGGVLVSDEDLTPEWLRTVIPEILHDEQRLLSMSHAAAEFGDRDSDERMARWILSVGEMSGNRGNAAA
jgi:UDP-N-acetylglucosamine--N-acetylmuramyl-(pentapeptide) pyrophosphoryl-undecaprenol N-acetylglucosamine transferase